MGTTFTKPPRPPSAKQQLAELELEPEDYEALGPSRNDYLTPLHHEDQRDFLKKGGWDIARGLEKARSIENPIRRRKRRAGYRKELHVREYNRAYDREYGQRPEVKVKKGERYDRWAQTEEAKKLIAARARRYRAKLKKQGKKVVRKKPYKRKSRAKPR